LTRTQYRRGPRPHGSRDKTWTAGNRVHWLRNLLPHDLMRARILSWGYDANTHSGSRVSCQYLYSHAQTLVANLCLERQLTEVGGEQIEELDCGGGAALARQHSALSQVTCRYERVILRFSIQFFSPLPARSLVKLTITSRPNTCYRLRPQPLLTGWIIEASGAFGIENPCQYSQYLQY
jgi:hypothetical protein